MEAELKFERENRDGVAVVGSYLIDAARRLGIEIEDECGRLGLCDTCAVKITAGMDCLSPLTKAEIEQLSEDRRAAGERLSCQAKIVKEGEISIVTFEKKKEEKPDEERRREEFRKEFEELPLEKKIARLVELEAVALGETFSFILNSPYTIVGKVLDVMANFGLKLDRDARDTARPEEHKEETETEGEAAETKETQATEEKNSHSKRAKKTDEEKEEAETVVESEERTEEKTESENEDKNAGQPDA